MNLTARATTIEWFRGLHDKGVSLCDLGTKLESEYGIMQMNDTELFDTASSLYKLGRVYGLPLQPALISFALVGEQTNKDWESVVASIGDDFVHLCELLVYPQTSTLVIGPICMMSKNYSPSSLVTIIAPYMRCDSYIRDNVIRIRDKITNTMRGEDATIHDAFQTFDKIRVGSLYNLLYFVHFFPSHDGSAAYYWTLLYLWRQMGSSGCSLDIWPRDFDTRVRATVFQLSKND